MDQADRVRESEWVNPLVAIVEKLKALDEKKLLFGQVWDATSGLGCAMGSCLPTALKDAWRVVPGAWSITHHAHGPQFEAWIASCNLTMRAVRRIEEINDADDGAEPSGVRYCRVLEAITRISEMGEDEYKRWSVGEGETEEEDEYVD